jgi:molybdopterin-guanine dinucleotide biosynthesis protein MobB
MTLHSRLPIVGFVAPSGTGKTTLLRSLIALFKQAGIRVAVIKHSHHDFEIDKAGKDSYELRMAGAQQMLITSKYRWALIHENDKHTQEVALAASLSRLDQTQLDLILVEGFKFESFPKIAVYRAEQGQIDVIKNYTDIIAIATDEPQSFDATLPLLDLNTPQNVFQFICQRFTLTP